MKEEEWEQSKTEPRPESRIYRNTASGGLRAPFIPIRASAVQMLWRHDHPPMTIHNHTDHSDIHTHSNNSRLLGTRWRNEQTWFHLPQAYWLTEKLVTHLWNKSEWSKFYTVYTCRILWIYRRWGALVLVENKKMCFGEDRKEISFKKEIELCLFFLPTNLAAPFRKSQFTIYLYL